MDKETVLKILDNHITKYDNIINDSAETKVRKFVANSAKTIVLSIKEEIINAENDSKEDKKIH